MNKIPPPTLEQLMKRIRTLGTGKAHNTWLLCQTIIETIQKQDDKIKALEKRLEMYEGPAKS